MATTESRTGFRLPWSTDRAASREASADPAEDTAGSTEPEAGTAVDGGAPSEAAAVIAPEPNVTSSDHDAGGDAVPGQQEDPVTTLAPDAAPSTAAAAPAGQMPRGGPSHRPTKFLADLTRAMQAAAEQARLATLDQFRAEGTTVIEQIHARSSTGAVDLRRRADDDVAAIKEWSKAEIARIREETEHRVAARREQLEGQLERHAALIEHEIEKVRGRIASFESEMGGFFDDLAGEEDPAVFATRAATMPEPPSFENLEEDALASLLDEPGVGLPAPGTEATPPVAEAPASAAEIGEAATPGAEAIEGAAGETPATTEPELANTPPEMTSLDREEAIAAIAAAAEAAAAIEVTGAEADLAEGADAGAEPSSDPQPEAALEAVAESEPPGAEANDAGASADAEAEANAEPALDPRLAMLGLTPDFAAAEAAAAEAAASEVEDVPEIGGEALAARLSGLVPADAAAEPAVALVTTQVVTTGLVSVASIASFKRHLGRLAGVAHVGVSSGPDGEFVFAVEHDPAASLRDLIPTLPGFAARVVGSGEGIVQVSAQDPQD